MVPWQVTPRSSEMTCRRSVVVSALASVNVANRHWVRLLLGQVTACGHACKPSECVNSHLGRLGLLPCVGW